MSIDYWRVRAHTAEKLVKELKAERAHSVGCEHHEKPPHRCGHGLCYRQWQADRIAQLKRELTDLKNNV